ncbi:MT-A70 family methyltransferase [Hyphomicrobium sp.]|uniref:MT-A70 family methyltransferase n=1 Tax=Hyphomicrobium sp. TaxID=82 RepID=UPI0035638051
MADWPFGDLPRGGFACVTADPPWHFRARTALQSANWTSRRDAEKHYDVLSVEDIKALPVGELAAKDAHLFLWITGPMIVQGTHVEIMKAWGFKPSSMAFTWVKLKRSHNPLQLRCLPSHESDLHVSLGLTTRKNAEFCILGRRGNAKRLAKDVREIIMSPVREHSRKPDEFFDRVQRYCAGPYVELFSRQSRENWSSWGNQAGLFDASLRSRADPLSGASKGRGRRGAPDALQEGIVEEDAGE